MKKIAIVSDAIYPYNKGGKEKRIYEISTRLAKAGLDVHIYTMKWWKEQTKNKIENGVHLHAISPRYALYSGERRSFLQAILFSIACLSLLKERFDILEVDHMPHLILFPLKIVAILKRKKLYVTWNEVWGKQYWIEYLGKLGTLAYLIEWASSKLPDKIIAVSEHTKEKLITDLTTKQPITVITNGINISLINSIPSGTQKSDIIFAGRLLQHKQVDVLINAIALVAKKHTQIKALIVGNGPEKEKLEQLARKKGLQKNIFFLGFLETHEQLYALFKASKMLVFPSTREGFGITALEAMACNIPVITSNHKDNAAQYFITEGKNGYVTDVDSQQIAQKIIALLETKQTINNQEIIKNYNWDSIAKKILEEYSI